VKVENGEESGFGPRLAGLGWHVGEGRENMSACGLGGKGGGPVWPEREGRRKGRDMKEWVWAYRPEGGGEREERAGLKMTTRKEGGPKSFKNLGFFQRKRVLNSKQFGFNFKLSFEKSTT
jgi:hypothetical protein